MQYYKMPLVVFDDKIISSSSKMLFCLLLNLAGKAGFCWANNTYLSEKMVLSERQIKYCLRELESAKYINRRADTEKSGARQVYIAAQFLVESSEPTKAESAIQKTDKAQIDKDSIASAKRAFSDFYQHLHKTNYAFGTKEIAKLKAFLESESAENFVEFLANYTQLFGKDAKQIKQYDAKSLIWSDPLKSKYKIEFSPEKTNIFYILACYNDLKINVFKALCDIDYQITDDNSKLQGEPINTLLTKEQRARIKSGAFYQSINPTSPAFIKEPFILNLYKAIKQIDSDITYTDIKNDPLAIEILYAIEGKIAQKTKQKAV